MRAYIVAKKELAEGTYVRGVRLNANGTYTVKKMIGYKDDGRQKVVTCTGRTQEEAWRLVETAEEKWKQYKGNEINEATTVAELCRQHVKYKEEKKIIKSKSLDRNESTIENQIAGTVLGEMQIQAVTDEDFLNFMNDLISGKIKRKPKKKNGEETPLSYSSIKKAYDVVNSAFDWARRQEIIVVNPVEKVQDEITASLKKMKDKGAFDGDVRVMTEEEYQAFKKTALQKENGNRVYPAGIYGMILLLTGMRCGELLGLKWCHVDFNNNTVTIVNNRSNGRDRKKEKELQDGKHYYTMVENETKNLKARTIAVTYEVMECLRILYEEAGCPNGESYVCITSEGNLNTTTNLSHGMHTIYKNIVINGVSLAVELKYSLHVLRATFATRQYDMTGEYNNLASYMGDLPSTVWEHYIAKKRRTGSGEDKRYVVNYTPVDVNKNKGQIN